MGSRLAMMRSFLVAQARFRLHGLGTLQRRARRWRSEAGLKNAITRANFSPQLTSDLDRIYADLLPPRPFIPGTVSLAMMGPAQGDNEFIAHFSTERPRLHEAKMVGIAGLSSAYETGLLGDKSE